MNAVGRRVARALARTLLEICDAVADGTYYDPPRHPNDDPYYLPVHQDPAFWE